MRRHCAAPLPGRAMTPDSARGNRMLYTIAIVLLVLWVLGFSVFHVAGGLIHIILVVAVVLFVLGLFRGRTA
jgi:hypothetical protein